MTTREVLEKVLNQMTEDQVRQVMDFAMFLRWQAEDKLWHQYSLEQLAAAYGEDEPDYSKAMKP